MGDSSSKKKEEQSPESALGKDLFLEILARVPYRCLCRLKCVSRSWLALCSDPEIRRRSLQALSGFFYRSEVLLDNPSRYRHHFTNVSGRGQPMLDPSLSYLPAYDDIEFVDSCNGLLLLKCKNTSSEQVLDYVVCNPVMEKWTILPDLWGTEIAQGLHELYLCFDPAVSSHFRVFLLVQVLQDDWVYFLTAGVGIYSSETRKWTYKQSEWTDNARCLQRPQSIFLNNTFHLITLEFSVLTVDIEGKTWRTILTPQNFTFIGLSKGRLYATYKVPEQDFRLAIWFLKDYSSEQWDWELSRDISSMELFGMHYHKYARLYRVIAIHPESSLFFLVAGLENNLMSYDMDSKNLRDICTLGEYCVHPYLPYIPCFSEWLSDRN